MSGDLFDRDWLTLREDADHRSRAPDLTEALREAGGERGWLHVLDLGAGTGSNLRYLRQRLPWARSWTLVDHDRSLLEVAAKTDAPDLTLCVGDIAHEGIGEIAAADVVTASALLDLVSRPWLEAAISACAERGAGLLFALSYDGSIAWSDEDADDDRLLDALNEHQQGEKGLGRALGPDAVEVAVGLLRQAGYETRVRPSPWRLAGEKDRALTLALMRGWVDAAIELRPAETARLRSWEERRREQVITGRYEVVVGHDDLLALAR